MIRTKAAKKKSTELNTGPGVGELLKASRERSNVDLRDVASSLRIRFVYLESIEKCAYDDLPGATYAVGFIRAYSDYLGLDSNEVVRRFKEEVHGVDARSQLEFPSPVAERNVPGGALMMIGLAVAATAYGGWYYLTSQNKANVEQVPSLPEKFASMFSGSETSAPKADGEQASTSAPQADEKAGEEKPAEAIAPTTEPEPEVKANDTPASAPENAAEPATSAAEAPAAVNTPAESTTAPQAAPAAETPVNSTKTETAPQATAPQQEISENVIPPSEEQEGGDNSDAAAQTATAPAAAATVAPQPTSKLAAVVAPVAKPTPPTRPVAKIDASAEVKKVEDKPAAPAEAAKVENAKVEAAKVETPKVEAPKAETPKVEAAKVETSAPAPASSEASAATPTASKHSIVITAVADVWIQIHSEANDETVLTKMLRQGESYDVPKMTGLTLLTGNAGALTITIDGKNTGPLGAVGAIRRNVRLDGSSLEASSGTTNQ